jgi:hypothetical protein
MADQRAAGSERLSRRDFVTRGVPGRVAALLGSALAAAPADADGGAAAPPAPGSEISARDLRKMSRDEVRQALRRIRAQRRAP